jgi:uncharacterized protein
MKNTAGCHNAVINEVLGAVFILKGPQAMIDSRRNFLIRASQAAVAVPALHALGGCVTTETETTSALVADPAGQLDLPPGFSYTAISRTGETMSDGFLVPGKHDGMAAFSIPGDRDRCVIVRNHENGPGRTSEGAFGTDHQLAARLDPALIYDRAANGRPLLGGTTSLIWNLREKRLEQSVLTLAGTATNCAGGPTPWGSWLTCEETQETPGANAGKMHGFVFEVPSGARAPVTPLALTAMGRFKHEACAVDPSTGIVYQTEDTGDSLIYRFLPDAPGNLARGGKLQALILSDQPRADTRNWTATTFRRGDRYAVSWIDMRDVTAPDGDLRLRGHAAGAALFARGEGMCIALEGGKAAIYFTCTSGGAARRGQVWKLIPGQDDAADTLELYAESTGEAHFDMCDNIEPSPWGDIIFSEDGGGENFVRGISPSGIVYPIARNAHNDSEICGPCFSPDGSTLFLNVQNPGITYAITGPWAQLARAARQLA